MDKNILYFKYKNDKFYNIISFILFIIFVLLILFIFNNINNNLYRLLYSLLSFIVIDVLMVIFYKLACTVNGKITLDKHSFIYETLNNEYTINYQEIESISKNTYMDTNNFMRQENYVYKIQIKNAGYFEFKYHDNSLIEVVEQLALKANIEIDE